MSAEMLTGNLGVLARPRAEALATLCDVRHMILFFRWLAGFKVSLQGDKFSG